MMLQVDKVKNRVQNRPLHPVEKQIDRVTMSQLVQFIGRQLEQRHVLLMGESNILY